MFLRVGGIGVKRPIIVVIVVVAIEIAGRMIVTVGLGLGVVTGGRVIVVINNSVSKTI